MYLKITWKGRHLMTSVIWFQYQALVMSTWPILKRAFLWHNNAVLKKSAKNSRLHNNSTLRNSLFLNWFFHFLLMTRVMLSLCFQNCLMYALHSKIVKVGSSGVGTKFLSHKFSHFSVVWCDVYCQILFTFHKNLTL